MLAQANKIDGGEIVDGYLVQLENNSDSERTFGIQMQDCYVDETNNQLDSDTIALYISNVSEIAPKTIKYSFDDGVSFYSESEVQNIINFTRELSERHSGLQDRHMLLLDEYSETLKELIEIKGLNND